MNDFLMALAEYAKYWSDLNKTPLEQCNGLVHSILAHIDGVAQAPSLTLYQDGTCLNPDKIMLHEIWNRYEHKA